MIKKINVYAYALQMGTYKSFDKNKCTYFLIKEEKVFDKCNEIWEKVSNIIKKINSELIYIKNI